MTRYIVTLKNETNGNTVSIVLSFDHEDVSPADIGGAASNQMTRLVNRDSLIF
jgi:aspartyl aminopeptidase